MLSVVAPRIVGGYLLHGVITTPLSYCFFIIMTSYIITIGATNILRTAVIFGAPSNKDIIIRNITTTTMLFYSYSMNSNCCHHHVQTNTNTRCTMETIKTIYCFLSVVVGLYVVEGFFLGVMITQNNYSL